ncbi:hypothetical protein GCM10010269_79320 [Streptomyces humidus]|uniref:Uncharacterized protein n=1 Tax=Streptomyces humidus TaxID=52259 RepID=A0A918LC85_9ACTN|nr:hypothetical protein [Streptomyces humidus]GGS28706.1 hypothetical protein GCM10010269_79320 [Streptomyces humidus]
MHRPAVLAPAVCVLATAAAMVSFARGAWVGVVWVLLAGVTSDMAWFYVRRARAGTAATTATVTGACANSGACGVCVKQACR